MSLQDSLFAEDVEYDVTLFARDRRRRRVLVFPPVNNYLRFVIHQYVQNRFADLLHTFSIGQGLDRRTVVCYKSDLIRDPKLNGAECKSGPATRATVPSCGMDVEGQRSPSASPEDADQQGEGSYSGCPIATRLEETLKELTLMSIGCLNRLPAVGPRPPATRRARKGGGNHQHQPVQQNHVQHPNQQQQTPTVTDSSAFAKSSRQKRPDRAIYVPRHRRSLAEKGSPQPSSDTGRTSLPAKPGTPSSKFPANNPSKETDSTARRTSKERNSKQVLQSSDCEASEGNSKESTQSGVSTGTECSRDRPASVADEKTTGDGSSEHVPNIVEKGELEESVMCEGKSGETGRLCAEKDETSSEPVVDECTRLSDETVSSNEGTDETSDGAPTSLEANDDGKTEESKDSNGSNDSDRIDEFVVTPVVSPARADRPNEEHSNRNEAINNRNRRLVRQKVVSDVLIISESARDKKKPTKEVPVVPLTPPEKKVKKIERPKSKPAPPPSPPMKINRDECDWDSLFDDNGDCLDPTLIEELTSAVGEVTIEQPKNDYKAFSKQVEVSSDEFAHVVEIYNFPSDFKTSDLAAVFSPFKNGGFELKWVDDTHCLGVFSSPLVAAEVLASDHPFVKTRPLSEATTLSKTKARRSAEFLQPYRSRPETCAALARRLVTGALGVKLATARQEREHEKKVLREAKEKRRLANKQREDAWEGIIPEK